MKAKNSKFKAILTALKASQLIKNHAGRDDKVRAKHYGLNRKYFLITSIISAVILFLMIMTVSRLNSVAEYVDDNNKTSVHALLEQTEHTYHAHLEQIYNEMRAVEMYLFTGNDRVISLKDHRNYFKSVTGGDIKDVLFISRDSNYISAAGRKGSIDLGNGERQLFYDGISIAQSFADESSGEEFFIVARLTDPFTVNGEAYDAVAFSYERDVMENAFCFPAYGSKATVYVTNEKSELVYEAFSDKSDKYGEDLRNYNILKNMLEEGCISEAVYEDASEDFEANSSGTIKFEKDGELMYVAYRSLNDSPYMIVCEVPKSVVQNSIMDFKYMVSHTWALIISITILLMLIIGISLFFMISASKEAEFERKNIAQQKMYNVQLANANRALAEAVSAAERAKKEADNANAAKSNFLSNMSHDIRTPLNAVSGLTSLLMRDAEKPALVRAHVRKLTGACAHLMGLINDILDMSSIEEKKMVLDIDTVSIAELIRESDAIIRPQARAKNQNFRIRVHGIINEFIEGDRVRLNQIAVNILSNAVKYTNKGGNITFDIAELESNDADRLEILMTITDDGQGMSEDFQKIIFEPFAREKRNEDNLIQGTGLGMAIVSNLVNMMGGSISVSSRLGEGSTFKVRCSFRKGIPARGAGEMLASLNVLSILIVGSDFDDINSGSGEVRRMEDVLSVSGVSAAYVSGPSQAFEIFASAEYGINQHFDVVIFKMNEYCGNVNDSANAAAAASELMLVKETASRIRSAAGENAPMIIASVYEWGYIENDLIGSGIDGCILQPFFISELCRCVENIRLGMNDAHGMTEIPCAYEKYCCGNGTDKQEGSVLDGMKIMIVDDNGMNSDILSELLCLEGADCVCAENGRAAVELFESSKVDEYDVILMDVRMPVMNGYEAAKMIRASGRSDGMYVPIIAMTANGLESDVKEALDAGMNAYISKPIDMNIVNETLKPYRRIESA